MRILITGANGQVGSYAVEAFGNDDLLACSHADLDISIYDDVAKRVREFSPDVILNCASMTNVDQCELDPDAAYRANAFAIRELALAANEVKARVVHISTDYVFDGNSERPYNEWDWNHVHPTSVYGKSKLGGERELIDIANAWSLVRTSWVFGRPGGDFFSWAFHAFREGKLTGVIDDQHGTLTYASDLVAELRKIIDADIRGIIHVANSGVSTRYEQVEQALKLKGLDSGGLTRQTSEQLSRPAPRPKYSALDCAVYRNLGWEPLRSWQEALKEYLEGNEL